MGSFATSPSPPPIPRQCLDSAAPPAAPFLTLPARLFRPPPPISARLLHQGEIKEGSLSEVRAAIFVVAVTREVDADTGTLVWRAAEISYNAGQLFL